VALLTGEIRPPVRRAILCSGFHNLITTAETARNLGVELSHEVGEPADLRAVAAPDLIAAQNALDSPSWGPAAECDGVPKTPLAAAEAGSAAGIDVLVLTNRDETGLFMGLNPEFDDPDDLATIDAAADYAGSPQRAKQLLAAYRDARQARGEATANRWLLIAVSTDAVFRNPANALADALAAHGNVHVGVFEHPSPALDGRLGACHAMMLPFAFGTYDHSSCATLAGTTVNRQLTERVAITAQSVWARFAATGDPGWTAYTTGSRTTGRIADAITSQSDPFVAERYAWNE
jgi:para-nitrobenzyl esterase